MQRLKTESFDRFGRYSHVWEFRQTIPIPAGARILDVGDPYGVIGRLFPADHTASVDFLVEPFDGDAGHSHLVGSGTALPFATSSFDLVVSHDALEHVPADLRLAFLDELVRVSRGPVLVVAPFLDARTVQCEEVVNAYYTARFGSGIHQLEEHRSEGLPDLRVVRAWADDRGLAMSSHGDGWLYAWLTFMLVKAHLVSEQLGDVDRRMDIAFNEHLRNLDSRAPHYRRVITIGRDSTADAEPDEPEVVAQDILALMQLASSLTTALPRGTDPTTAHSPLRAWVERQQTQPGPGADVADALTVALNAAASACAVVSPDASTEATAPPQVSVSIVVVNLNGADHLRTLLRSLDDVEYPPHLLDLIIVDNGSTDDSLAVIGDRPRTTVLEQGSNVGFAPAVNIGVRASTADCVVLLNNDMRVDSAFISNLVRSFAPEDGYVCVGARILSWDGERVDFGEGSLNYYGMGSQIGYGADADSIGVEDGQELLFACGGAMLVGRQTFLEVGGFDDDFFAYFEDVDLGWRLRLLGYGVRLVKDAICYHRMHGTSSRFPYHQRLYLYERNALRAMLKNYEARNLAPALAAALLLASRRGQVAGQLSAASFVIGGDDAETEVVPRVALSATHAVVDVLDDLDAIVAKRRVIQAARQVRDDELSALFAFPFLPTAGTPEYVDAQYRVSTLFGLDRLFDKERASTVVVITSELVGDKMRGPAIRALEIAKALAFDAQTTLAVPALPNIDAGAVTVEAYESSDDLLRIVEGADVVVVQGYTLRRHPVLKTVDALIVADLYDPWLFESMEIHRGAPWGDDAAGQEVSVLNELLDTADAFICASERQRDYWIGMLASRGRLDESTYEWDSTFRKLIDVVPFGLPTRRPRRDRPVLKGVHPAVAEDDLVILWGGGAWDWFDPLSVIRAMETVVGLIPRAKLYFLGLQLKDENVEDMRMAAECVQLAESLGLAGTSVIFGDWAPYEEREAYLLEADVAISAARDLAETRLAFRSRLLDAFWAGLPVVATSGDVLSETVREFGAGIVVEPGNVGALADALVRLLGDPVRRAEASAQAEKLATRFQWKEGVAPLRRLLRSPWEHHEARRHRAGRQTSTTSVVLAHLRRRLAGLQEHGDTAERLYREQLARAELHLQEVKELLHRNGELELELSEAVRNTEALRVDLAARDVALAKLRNHPAYRAYQKLRDVEHQYTRKDRER